MYGPRVQQQKVKLSLEKPLKTLKFKKKRQLSKKMSLLLLKGGLRTLHIEPIGQSTEEIIPPIVPAPAIVEEVVAEGAAHFEGEYEDIHIEETPNVPEVGTALKESHEDTVAEVVAPGHTEDIQMIDAPAQGEPEILEEPDIQGEHAASAPADQFQEDDDVELAVGSGGRGKGVAPEVPLLTRKAHHKSRKKKIYVHLEPVIARLNAHAEILCSLQSDISSIFISQSTGAKEIGAVKTELQEMRNELGSLKKLDVGPSGPSVAESRPPGPPLEESGPSGPCAVEDISAGPSGPSVQMESMAGSTGPQVSVEEAVVPPGPSESPNLQTPAPSSPPTSFTTPPAPKTFKKPLPKHISSPIPFPTATSSSPPPSSSIHYPTSEAPPTSSSSANPSSAGPSSAGPSTQPLPTSSFGSFHLPTPPSFITIIPEAASVIPHSMHDIKDEFEEVILRTVLAVSAHIHRNDSQPSSSPASKKRKTSSALAEQAKILSTAESKTEDQWVKANK
ncbi:hypothetical protein Taro_029874 [Colocasia esculenta]|uniref:Uncharacterized protein n=1 Tax=Colocasia esculenta TaxID=4460 RepID=A0A843VKY4_COLES|nr:hypothetical protein [Colocasia esculenta]